MAAPTVVSSGADNPFLDKVLYANTQYKSEIQKEYNSLVSQGNTALAAKVEKLTNVSTGIWISSNALVPTISTHLQEALNVQKQTGKEQIVLLVIYDLPEKNCASSGPHGEFSYANGGEAKYQGFIKDIAAQLQLFPDVKVAIILEPNSINDTVRNLSTPLCANVASGHKKGLAFAISVLGALSNVNMYLCIPDSGFLLWPANILPAAMYIGDIYTAAKNLNPNATTRGVATDVGGYSTLDQEVKYHAIFAPYLTAVGYPAHFVVDQGRSGRNVTVGSDKCVQGAGLGPRPTSSTANPLLDAILWVQPPGETDGNSTRCELYGSNPTNIGTGFWDSRAFRSLVTLANPPL
ncbi:glycoside hydrolase family 6 protein [Ceratobasidium sp. AG-Ba]|nr:glycoside hydrolase family 6 protein [Ceratobasidium sp. AG-Ba]